MNNRYLNPSPFKYFCTTIGELPSSYLESMSYYETLMWLCNYLEETVIPTVNNNANAVTELQNLFNELKSYVDNYFTNLDVQTEINNKLDEMAESGVLSDYLKNYYESYTSKINDEIDEQNKKIDSIASGSPLKADSIAQMTDTNRIYVLPSDGYWYYYNGTEWTKGGIYQASVDSTDIETLKSYNSRIALNCTANINVTFDETNLHVYTTAASINIQTERINRYFNKKFDSTFSTTDYTLTKDQWYCYIDYSDKTIKIAKYGVGINQDDIILFIFMYVQKNKLITLLSNRLIYNNYEQGLLNNFDNFMFPYNVDKKLNFTFNSDTNELKFLGITSTLGIYTNKKAYAIANIPETSITTQGKYAYRIIINATTKLLRFEKFGSDNTERDDITIGYFIAPNNLITLTNNIYLNNIEITDKKIINEISDISLGYLDINVDWTNLKVNIDVIKGQGIGSSFVHLYLYGNDKQIKLPFGNSYEINLPTNQGVYALVIRNNQFACVNYYSEPNDFQNNDFIVAIFDTDYTKSSSSKRGVILNSEDISIKGQIDNEIKEKATPIINQFKLLSTFDNYSVISDSLSAGYTKTSIMSSALDETTNPSTIEKGWNAWNYIAKRNNIICNNYSHSGSDTNDWRTNTSWLDDLKKETQCYFLALGGNDQSASHSIEVGTTSDILNDYNNNPNTFYGNYDFLIRTMHESNPNAKIFILTLPRTYSVTEKAEPINNAIKYFATLYNYVYLVDINKNINDTTSNPVLSKLWINGHLEPIGYNYLSSLLENEINNTIISKIEDFQNIPMIFDPNFPTA